MEKTYYLPEGTVLQGKYYIQAVIGEGGFGITYRAFDGVLKRQVAVKEYYPSVLVSRNCTYQLSVEMTSRENADIYQSGKNKFINEAEKLALFHGNPQIVYVIEYFEANNTAYIVMEYLEGETLLNMLKRVGKLRLPDALDLLDPVMTALCMIHRNGLIHRDISPDNIIFRTNGQPCLLDFGAAREFEKSVQENRGMTVILKRSYAPEEQYRTNGQQGPWTDVYAMAAVLYRCITGNPPAEVSERIYQGPNKRTLDFGGLVSRRQEMVLAKGMAVFAKDRYQTMEEFQRDLRQCCAGEARRFIPGRGAEDLTRAFSSESGNGGRSFENSEYPVSTGKSKTSGAVKWVPVAVGAAALVLAAAIGSFVFMNKGKSDDSAKKTVKTETVKTVSESEKQSADAEKKTEKSKVTEVPKVTEAPKPTETPEPTEAPEPQPTIEVAQPQVVISAESPAAPQPEYTTMYVVNCQESITLRPSPSTSSGEICQIPFGAAVSYVEPAENGFYKIIYNGRTGYGLAAYLGREPQSKPVQAPVQEETAPEAPSAQTMYVVNCRESITLRTSPSTEAGEICQIPLGAAVSFLGEAGNGFYTIQYAGQTGYALASYLSGSAATASSTATMQVVNCNESITLRKIPDTDGEEICQIPLGATVTFLSQAENGFYMISYNGQTGYSLASYLS